jgi:ABC-type dipeptide/oligopeptide/nickel transport system permease component
VSHHWTRLLRLVAVLLAVSAASFTMISLLPGDLATAVLGQNATTEQVDQIRQELRLDDPLPVRYARWLGDAATGDLGVSYRTRQPVAESIGQRTPCRWRCSPRCDRARGSTDC